jgi:cation diffusion facilitator family transporter
MASQPPRTSSPASAGAALRWAWASLAMAMGLGLAKLAAAAFTGSVALLSDALESLVNVAASLVTVRATAVSAQPRDDDHPYGHGRIEYVAAAAQAAMVAAAGGATLAFAIPRLLSGADVPHAAPGVIAGAGIAVVTLAFAAVLRRAGARVSSPALVADAEHLRADSVTTIGSVAGLAVVAVTGEPAVDAVVALLLGLWMLWSARRMLRPAMSGLLDEADPVALEQIAHALETHRQPGWLAPHHVKTHRLGPNVHVDLHLVLPRFWSLDAAHDVAETVEAALQETLGEGTDTMVHLEPCTPVACTGCDLEDCPVRSEPFVARERWDAASVSRRERHPRSAERRR